MKSNCSRTCRPSTASIPSLYYCSIMTRTQCLAGRVLPSLAVIDSETGSRSLIAAISQRAAAILTTPMTPRPSSSISCAHTPSRTGRGDPSGLIVASVCWARERWKRRQTHTPGRQKAAFSPVLASNVGLWVPGLISLAVRLRTTGPRLALHQVPRYELKSSHIKVFFSFFFLKEAFFNLTKRTSISRIQCTLSI